MCKPGKSFKTEIKSYSFLHEKAVQAGLRPVPTPWLDQPPVGGVQKRTV